MSSEFRNQAEEALKKAEEAEKNSEYPRLGKASYTELSNALTELAEAVEAPATEPRAENAFEIKRARRIDRLKRKAAYLRVEAAKADCRSHDIGRCIPFGQPILVGHHSERGHRNAIAKMRRASDKAHELYNLAQAAENSASRAESNYTISSDDPTAIEKLKAKLSSLEREKEGLKQINVLVKKNDVDGLKAMGLSEQTILKLFNPQFSYERPGVPAWRITNLSSNMRRVRDRIAEIERLHTDSEIVEITANDFKVFEDTADNRICFKFDGKPEESVRSQLKSNGFKWSPSRGLWVRQLNTAGRYAAISLAKAFLA